MERHCILVPAEDAQKAKKVLKSLQAWDNNRRLMSIKETGKVAIPVSVQYHDSSELLSAVREKLTYPEDTLVEIKETELPIAKKLLVKSPEMVLLEGITKLFNGRGIELTEEISQEIPGHWEKHGDLVLLPDKAFSSEIWKTFGDELWHTVCSSLQCRRLGRKSVVSRDGFRSPQVVLLYGANGWVEQVDNGIRYSYDVTKCMFSSGNITEKLRVSRFDCTGEIVVDLYAGIGYFALPYLMYTGVKHLHACEWNPDAIEALRRNVQLNQVADRCTIHAGDNRKMCPKDVADRVNLGLIPSSEPGWRTACAAIKSSSGGILHIHGNVNTKSGMNEALVTESKTSSNGLVNTSKITIVYNHTTLSESPSMKRDNCDDISTRNGATGFGTDSKNSRDKAASHSNNDVDSSVKIECSASNDAFHHVGTMVDHYNASKSDQGSKSARDRECTELAKRPVKADNSYLDTYTRVESYALLENEVEAGHVSKECKWLPWALNVSMKIRNILKDVHGTNWRTVILHIEHVKSYAPFVDHVVLDLKCCPL